MIARAVFMTANALIFPLFVSAALWVAVFRAIARIRGTEVVERRPFRVEP